jgi:hypothetical protein
MSGVHHSSRNAITSILAAARFARKIKDYGWEPENSESGTEWMEAGKLEDRLCTNNPAGRMLK